MSLWAVPEENTGRDIYTLTLGLALAWANFQRSALELCVGEGSNRVDNKAQGQHIDNFVTKNFVAGIFSLVLSNSGLLSSPAVTCWRGGLPEWAGDRGIRLRGPCLEPLQGLDNED